jgi:hypothetical protein
VKKLYNSGLICNYYGTTAKYGVLRGSKTYRLLIKIFCFAYQLHINYDLLHTFADYCYFSTMLLVDLQSLDGVPLSSDQPLVTPVLDGNFFKNLFFGKINQNGQQYQMVQ